MRSSTCWIRAGHRAIAAASLLLAAPQVHGGLVEFAQDRQGFINAVGSSQVTVDFDGFADGTDIGGQTLSGGTFTAVGSPLLVVSANTTASGSGYAQPGGPGNRLLATSGSGVLSPGGATLSAGPDAAVENDDLQIDFAEPVGYVGVDHLSQRLDGAGYTRVEVINTQDQSVLNTIIPISSADAGEDGMIPGGADFWGIVSSANDIRRVIFNEVDGDANAPDNNVGYDSFRFGAVSREPPVAIPLPPALLAGPVLGIVAELVRRRTNRRRG